MKQAIMICRLLPLPITNNALLNFVTV